MKITGCLPFVRINRLGGLLNNGKDFSKISKPTKPDCTYHLQFDFLLLFLAAEELENVANGTDVSAILFQTEKVHYLWR